MLELKDGNDITLSCRLLLYGKTLAHSCWPFSPLPNRSANTGGEISEGIIRIREFFEVISEAGLM